MRFPISITKRDDVLYVQEIDYSIELASTPFVIDHLKELGIWKGLYSPSSILPVFSSSGRAVVLETPLDDWLRGHIPDVWQELNDVGFVFHTSRCGSTMFSEAAKCSKRIQVLSEPPILNSILSPDLDVSDDIRAELLRLAVTKMKQCRPPENDLTLVKTRSWNIIRSDLFEKSFPHSKALFVHRDTRDIVDSIRHKPPGWLRSFRIFARHFGATEDAVLELQQAGIEHQICFMIKAFCVQALNSGKIIKRALDYGVIKREFFDVIECLWKIPFDSKEADDVLASFLEYSKSHVGSKLPFLSDSKKSTSGASAAPAQHEDVDSVRRLVAENMHPDAVSKQNQFSGMSCGSNLSFPGEVGKFPNFVFATGFSSPS